MVNILGISAYYHDSAAALVRDGEIVAAAQEERFTRVKHDERWPEHAIRYCIDAAGIDPDQVDAIVFYEKPFIKLERLLDTFLDVAPGGVGMFLKALPMWAHSRLRIRKAMRGTFGPEWTGKILFTEHHRSHAAAAFYPSPFEEAAILTVDGVGEWDTTTIAHGKGSEIAIIESIHFPHSLGLLYSAFTYFCGFKVNSGEYKLMGLAPYGKPTYVQQIYEHLIETGDDGAFRLNMKMFDFLQGKKMTGAGFEKIFGGPARTPETPITQREMDLAASVQVVTEEIMLKLAAEAVEATGSRNLCLAGGVALNCVANGKILRSGIVDNLWIQPAAGDAGGALGAAMDVWHTYYGQPREAREGDAMNGAHLGPVWTDEDIEPVLRMLHAKHTRYDDGTLPEVVAGLIASEKVVGWFHGRMEFGPRALGARSIIGDSRSPKMQSIMNLKIKFRESFRPFAPCVLAERVSDYFEMEGESPYMLIVAPVKEDIRMPSTGDEDIMKRVNEVRSTVPAITHVDYSARVQTVDKARHGIYYDVIKAFEEKTGCGVIINTSFNIRGEPIVCRPEEAYRCFMLTDMDVLVLDHCVLLKEDQPPMEGAEEYRRQFKLD